MSTVEFTYDDYERTRRQLVKIVIASFDDTGKAFLLGLNRLEPDWSHYDFKDFSSVKWKLLNLEKFKNDRPSGYQQQLEELERILSQ